MVQERSAVIAVDEAALVQCETSDVQQNGFKRTSCPAHGIKESPFSQKEYLRVTRWLKAGETVKN